MNLAEEIRTISVKPGELAVCWLGQAGFLLKDSEGDILAIDPYLTNCGERMRGFKRLSPMLLQPAELRPRYLITTHMHFDHFDYDAIPIIVEHSPETLFLGPQSCMDKFGELGVPDTRQFCLNRGDSYHDARITVRATLADHGEMAPDAIGVLLEMGRHRLYFSGDTAFHTQLFRSVAEFSPELAAMSVNGHFGNMNAREGAEAALLTGAKCAVPCHCWTFMEHGGDPGAFCQRLLDADGCEPVCFRQGEIQILCENGTLRKRGEQEP
ncbi:MAG: MBL fold metallo-hydrolase [Oscillospiraceae bacterium]|nr:MBL fold metallo-hydrolase [Oscillospiraceae bacterium]